MCSCVGLKFDHVFSTCSSPALMCSSLEQNVFLPVPKVFVCSTINTFVFYLEGCLENTQKRTELRKKPFSKTSFQLRMELKKGQKQDRDERMQEEYPTSAVYFLQMSCSLLAFFHLCFVCPFFFSSILNWSEV